MDLGRPLTDRHKICTQYWGGVEATKLQRQNLATFCHSAVTSIAYLQHTVSTKKINAINNAVKKINRSTALLIIISNVHYYLQAIYCNVF